jgi:hypothetical protein
MLGLFTASAVSVIMGVPDIGLPLVAAAEILFLVSVAGNPRFQRSVDSRTHDKEKEQQLQSVNIKYKKLLDALDSDEETRFNNLKNRCLQLRKITTDLTRPALPSEQTEELRNAGIDKLLWLFLKLLYSKESLEKFFQTTTREEILASIKKLESRIEGMEDKGRLTKKIKKSLLDNMETSKIRLRNFDLAKENYQFILLELDRLENKISSILEVAINRQDPDFILNEVDSISQSVSETERTIGELDFLTGLGEQNHQVPPVLHTHIRRSTR